MSLIRSKFFTRSAIVLLIFLLLSISLFAATRRIVHADASQGPDLSVDVTANRHSISPNIYGISAYDNDAEFYKQIKPGSVRWGGDATTKYNWLQDSTNAGSDWYFMGGLGTDTPTAGDGVDKLVQQSLTNGNARTLVTVPLIGYVNKSSQWNCSYPESQYPPQQSYNPYIKLANGDRCGNGRDASGNKLADKNIDQNYTKIDSAWMQNWIKHIIQKAGPSSVSNVIYQLDNEPELWSTVHYDVHPEATGFSELVDKTVDYSSMIKSVDATAKTLGPSDGYPYSYIHLGDKPNDDRISHGQDWIPFYLQSFNAYQQQHGVRLLDYLDVHYYNLYANNAEDDATKVSRLNSTRALWDPTYNDGNAVGPNFSPPQQIGLIPALKSWVKQYYPGTKTSVSEYSFGDMVGLNGALTQADVLGIFGREGLDNANLWDPPALNQPGSFAFRMFLNFDGNGAQFGNVSVQASSADQGKLAVYSAQRSRDGAVTLVVVNKTANDLNSNLALKNFNPDANAHVYTYSNADLTKVVQQPDVAVKYNGFSATYPANSITTIVIPQSGKKYVGGAANGPAPSLRNTLQPDASNVSLYSGDKYQVLATSIDSQGVGKSITGGLGFTSDNTYVATVDNKGVVTAGQHAGKARILGTYKGKTFTVTVTVIAPQKVTAGNAYTLPTAAQHQTFVNITYTDGSASQVKADKVSFSSSNTAVAQVDAAGVVTAVAPGTADISAVFNGKTGKATVTVPTTSALPSAWQQKDIGTVQHPGNAVVDANGTYYVNGGGEDIYGDKDQSHFAYQPLPADGTVIARIKALDTTETYAKAGIMLRASLDSGGSLVTLASLPDGTIQAGTGDANVAPGFNNVWSSTGTSLPYWLKLVRTGTTVSVFISSDGQTWVKGTDLTFPAGPAYVGLFTVGHGAALNSTATFDNFSLTPANS